MYTLSSAHCKQASKLPALVGSSRNEALRIVIMIIIVLLIVVVIAPCGYGVIEYARRLTARVVKDD